MGKWHYYNEFDPFAAEWLRNLIKKGLIPDGEVDTRSIVDVRPDDVREFVQCHYFAGIAGWPLALKFAGWPEDRPVWTGSAPCQPWSVAGKGKGAEDERHLWPAFFRLIRECRPAIVFGEQVASRAGREWLTGVFSDLEGVGYAGAGADLCAPGVGAPHIRQRLYWVGMADAESLGRRGRPHNEDEGRREQPSADTRARGGDVADAEEPRLEGRRHGPAVEGSAPGNRDTRTMRGDTGNMADAEGQREPSGPDECSINSGGRFIVDGTEPWSDGLNDGKSVFGDVGDADDARREGRTVHAECSDELSPWSRGVEWRRGADGKERRVKPGVRLLVNGISGGVAVERATSSGETETHIYSRVGALRGFGNAIVPQLAAEFIKVFMSYGE